MPVASKYREVPIEMSGSRRPANGAGRGKLTGIALPVKVVLRIAVAAELSTELLPRRTVSERNMVVGDIVKEVDLVLLEHESSGDRVDRRVTPSLVEETAVLVERFEIVGVRGRSEPVQAADFEVGPLEQSLADERHGMLVE